MIGAPKSIGGTLEVKNVDRLVNMNPTNLMPKSDSLSNIQVFDDEDVQEEPDTAPGGDPTAVKANPQHGFKVKSFDGQDPSVNKQLQVMLKPIPPAPGWKINLKPESSYDESSEESQKAVAIASFRTNNQRNQMGGPIRQHQQQQARHHQHEHLRMLKKKPGRYDDSEPDGWFEPPPQQLALRHHQKPPLSLYHRGRPITSSEMEYSMEDEQDSTPPQRVAFAPQPTASAAAYTLPIQQENRTSKSNEKENRNNHRSHSGGKPRSEGGARAGPRAADQSGVEVEEEEYEKETINYERFVKKSSIKKTA